MKSTNQTRDTRRAELSGAVLMIVRSYCLKTLSRPGPVLLHHQLRVFFPMKVHRYSMKFSNVRRTLFLIILKKARLSGGRKQPIHAEEFFTSATQPASRSSTDLFPR